MQRSFFYACFPQTQAFAAPLSVKSRKKNIFPSANKALTRNHVSSTPYYKEETL